ncbi:hypothetical protein AB0300_18545 [Microbacterium sp. NPDC078814]|uniref:hypothetical protein n=1 Tax=Microbacterium sp. NPDC078814 TaxID=3154767 RepID=UPI00344BC458
MADDLSDVYAELRRLQERVRVLETANPLEASSITNGRVRFIGGLLRIDSGGRVEIVGTLQIDGTTTVTGTFTVTGNFKVTGPWRLEGPGDITGNVDVTGTIRVLAGGKIQVGNMVIDPNDGGRVTFPNGAVVQADENGGIQMRQGANKVFVGPGMVSMQHGARTFSITASAHLISGLDTIPSNFASGAPAGCIWSDGNEIFRVVP